MTLNEIARELGLESLTPAIAAGLADRAGAAVEKAHASDLLSDVLANAPTGAILLTIQVHMNVVAVALHAGLAAVVFTSGMTPDEAVRAKAEQEKLPLFATAESTFDAAGKLYAMGLRGAGSRRA
jgi:predicted transcriptional regulator